ncbi:hypothetical protein KAW50_03235 [candidate division WOR-3 bacterium]|nr:hypothetical protein [candidate division WOR-3 bacterium]
MRERSEKPWHKKRGELWVTIYLIPKFREWGLDRILDVLFLARYHKDYMVVYMDGDLGAYGNSKSIAKYVNGFIKD